MEHMVPCRFFGSTICLDVRSALQCFVLAALVLFCFVPASQGQIKKSVLMINELGQSHPGPVLVTNAIISALHSDPQFDVELYWENLDATDISDAMRSELRDSITKKHRKHNLALIVLMGPDPLRLLADPSKKFYPDIPVVFCCSVAGQIDPRSADSRSTGSWFRLDPAKTLDAAVHLLPNTRHVFVIGGQSRYDRSLTALVKSSLSSYRTGLDITYLTDLSMNELQERLKQLPSDSMVLYISFFKDAQGRDFLNVAEALPMITAASTAPVFAVSDTYLGHGVVGGFVVSFEEQGEIAARNVREILRGKAPRQIPVVYAPSVYMFDWRELQRWKLDERKLPVASTVLFRETTAWERHKWSVLTGLLFLAGLIVLIAFLLLERKKLRFARAVQSQLSGILINAQEAERRRLAAELHDDFSQRLALLALGLGTAAQIIPESPRGSEPSIARAFERCRQYRRRPSYALASPALSFPGKPGTCADRGRVL